MPDFEDTTCPFCGARFSPGASACPACDLPLLGDDGSPPPQRTRTPFDGASLFDEAFLDDEFMSERSTYEPPLATERRGEPGGDSLRCLVVAMNQAEADMLEDMLRAEGVPCIVRLIGAEPYINGRREVLVPQFALASARELLRIEEPPAELQRPSVRVLAGAIAIALMLAAACILIVGALT
jgi:hypothetical protein